MELSYISSVIKTNFLIFLALKGKNSCFFPGEPRRDFDFLPFSGVSFFTFLGFFIVYLSHFLPFSDVFVLLYRECYGFQRVFFSLRRFIPYTLSRLLSQPAFIMASLGAGSYSLKVAGPPSEVQDIALGKRY